MEEELLREKAEHYLVCYYEPCQQRERCLHWLAGPYVPETDPTKTCVNVMNAEVRAGRCPFFKSDEPVRMVRGMKQFYDQMPRRIAVGIKRQLEMGYGHTTYYKYRNGEMPIPPDMQKHIAEVCRSHGWNEEPVYDSTSEEYNW